MESMAKSWDVAHAIRQHGHIDTIRADNRELFKRMVFNILVSNDDDHLRNHGFIHDPACPAGASARCTMSCPGRVARMSAICTWHRARPARDAGQRVRRPGCVRSFENGCRTRDCGSLATDPRVEDVFRGAACPARKSTRSRRRSATSMTYPTRRCVKRCPDLTLHRRPSRRRAIMVPVDRATRDAGSFDLPVSPQTAHFIIPHISAPSRPARLTIFRLGASLERRHLRSFRDI